MIGRSRMPAYFAGQGRLTMPLLAAALLGSTALLAPQPALAQPNPCATGLSNISTSNQVVGRVVSAIGPVTNDRTGFNLQPHQILCAGDTITVGEGGRATIYLDAGGTAMKLGEKTQVKLNQPNPEEDAALSVFEGIVYFLSRVRRSLSIETPYANAGINGTEILVEVDRSQTGLVLSVYEGEVVFERGATLVSGEQIAISPDGGETVKPAPSDIYEPIVIDALGRMAWTLYYPPALVTADANAAVAEAATALASGNFTAANKLLQGENGDQAQALKALIALAQLRFADARDLVRSGLQAAPDSTALRHAEGFILQAEGNVDAAYEASAAALTSLPDQPTLLARAAELALATGRRDEARRHAQAAVDIAPSAPALTVLGFAALSEFATRQARDIFAQALEINPDYPLARLGIALALIRDGALAQGRNALELAVTADPVAAQARSYLGKLYANEAEVDRALTQLAMAITLDPDDPTPYLYRALLQAANARYLSALVDLEASTRRNDNRAVTRSSLLLDDDAAVRAASRGQIYQALGMDQTAINEAVSGLQANPTNGSAHRLLADIYGGRDRHEIAAASELFQAQIYGPSSLDPIRPSLPVTDFNIDGSGAPFATGLGEFTRLFEQDGLQGQATGVIGGRGLFAEEVVLAGRAKGFTIGVGQAHAQSDGFRQNNDVDNDVVTLFGQYQPNQITSFQAEYRYRNTERGDIDLTFDTDERNPNERREIDAQSLRLGLKTEPSVGSKLALALTLVERDEQLTDTNSPALGVTVNDDVLQEQDGYQIEGRFDADVGRAAVTIGGSLFRGDEHENNKTTLFIPGPGLIASPVQGVTDDSFTQNSLYAGVAFDLAPGLDVEASLGIQTFKNGLNDQTEPVGRLGISAMPLDGVTIRAAAYRTLTRPQALDQSLEPTNIAGFNVVFDDLDGSLVDGAGAGIDVDISPGLKSGIEAHYRDLRSPQIETVAGGAQRLAFGDHNELLAAAYLGWAPSDLLAINLGIVGDLFEASESINVNAPEHLRTLTLPIAVNLNHPSGFFGRFGADLVWQEQESEDAANAPAEGVSQFTYLSATMGYRFEQYGSVALSAHGALDGDFDYRDNNFRQGEVRRSKYAPGAVILLSASARF